MSRKVNTNELIGAALDWAVAKCLPDDEYLFDPHPYLPDENGQPDYFEPSTDWAQGGPIIENEEINLWTDGYAAWEATKPGFWQEWGPTPLIAAMRCYVGTKLGNEVEVPDELLEFA